jgi:3-isopropylmalate/(R)-2-methylmalate dehydratase large subunit
MPSLALPGRILFLSANPDRVEAQLAGRDLSAAEAGALRDDISTDEITPLPSLVFFDERLGDHVYTGFKSGDRLPVGTGAVQQGGFSVVVGGKRYGKGSSREHSPVAEMAAGIRLVVAESFERIYRQNADNIGLFTSTDFSLIDRIRRGEAIDIEELVASRDAMAASILKAGGLLRYGRQHLADTPAPAQEASAQRPRTLFEKILARHLLRTEDRADMPAAGTGVFVRADLRFIHVPACAATCCTRRLARISGCATRKRS